MESTHINLAEAHNLGIIPSLLLEMEDLVRGHRFARSILSSFKSHDTHSGDARMQLAWHWVVRTATHRGQGIRSIGPVRTRIVDQAFEEISGFRIRETHIIFDADLQAFLEAVSKDHRMPFIRKDLSPTDAADALHMSELMLELAEHQLRSSRRIFEPTIARMRAAELRTKCALLRRFV